MFAKQALKETDKEVDWVDLFYQYADVTPVVGADYMIRDPKGAVLAQGLTLESPLHQDLPLHATNVRVEFHNDPELKAYLKEPIKNPEKEKEATSPGWFDRMTGNIKNAAQWTWGTLQEDFNEDPTIGQIIVNTAITMIPVVDQVGDVRDIGASLRLLVWIKRYNDYLVWVGLAFCIIGLFPTVGSLLKGVLKMVWKGTGLESILKIFNHFTKGNGVKFLNKLKDTELDNIHKICP